MQGWPLFGSAPFWAIFVGTLLLVRYGASRT